MNAQLLKSNPEAGRHRELLSAGKVALRHFEPGDAQALYEAVRESVHEITKWMVWCHPEYSLTDAADFVARHPERWRERERFDLAIYQPSTGILLGSVGISHVDWHHRCGSLGYWVRTDWTNQGVARVAIGLAARFAFEELQLNRLEFLVETENLASLQAARRAGAKVEGVLRQRLLVRGRARDAVVLSLLRAEMVAFP